MIEGIYQIVAAIIPAYFYFLPAILIPKLFDRFVKTTFTELKEGSLDGFEEVNRLKNRFARLLSFASFLSIYCGVLISIGWGIYRNTFDYGLTSTSLTFTFVSLGFWVIFKNISGRILFVPAKTWVLTERILILLSIYLLGFAI